MAKATIGETEKDFDVQLLYQSLVALRRQYNNYQAELVEYNEARQEYNQYTQGIIDMIKNNLPKKQDQEEGRGSFLD